MIDVKRRTIATIADLHVRATGEGQDSRIIEGYALKFGVRSRLLCDWWNDYYEVLEAGCLSRATLDAQDIKLTMFHDREKVLARSKDGEGTLHYEVDSVGVRFWAEMPATQHGDEALELVRRGDIKGCSFIYSTDEDDSVNCVRYENVIIDGEEAVLRHVLRIDNVYDFTITTDPAYEQTTVSRREVEAAGVRLAVPQDTPSAAVQDGDEGDTTPDDGVAVADEKDGVDCVAKRETLRATRVMIANVFNF